MMLSVVGLWVGRGICVESGRYFLGDTTYHHHSRKLREDALKMYSNGVGMRAISRVLNIPLGCSLGLSVMVGGSMRN
ncbi:hypothetical protein MetMK1DRAFT_00017150 [Metallosphaera yellowstonensis MK1]|uniref:Uncharacterized protein n=1 Tax=Metallosphaera yellowstonensis MK1 TaxID=671065 RepID=H2C592_9CREN|nr:hypothetical protein MetMK1DRAFT_00017150 [Metallosphaera yellowstonensis MK1]